MSLLFRFLNFLSRDRLRNYLAIGVYKPLNDLRRYFEDHPDVGGIYLRGRIERAISGCEDIFTM